jgi:hypothetical protein
MAEKRRYPKEEIKTAHMTHSGRRSSNRDNPINGMRTAARWYL